MDFGNTSSPQDRDSDVLPYPKIPVSANKRNKRDASLQKNGHKFFILTSDEVLNEKKEKERKKIEKEEAKRRRLEEREAKKENKKIEKKR